MMYHKGKLNIYNFRGFAILLSLFTLIVMFPARAERGDFLDNISKLEINNPPASDAASGDSASANQHNNSRDKKAPQKQDVVRKKVNQTKTESTLNALRKQNAELTAAAKAAEKKLDETTRQLSAQIAALKAQRGQQESGDPAAVSALMKKNAELTAAADTAQKKLDDTTRDLSAQISALKAQNAQRESGQKTALDALTKKNAELTAAAAAAQKKLDDTTRDLSAQISALKAQNTQRESGQKAALDALTKKNAELIAAAAAAQKNLDDMTRTMSVQIAALQTQKEQGESLQKTTIDTLTGKNLELRAAAAATQKKLDETTRVLSAKIAALKNENTQGESQQKTALDALSKKNAELIAAAETAQKKYDASVAALNDKNKELQSTLDSLAIKQSDVNLADKSNKNAYALGVFYLTQALSDVNKMADNNVKLAPSALVSGFNDAYNKKLKIKENEIESIVNMLNEKLSSKYVDIEKRIMAKIKNKKYEILPNGVYFVIDKKGKEPYKSNETLSMNILEKKLDGTPILNTMNSKMVYDKQIDPLMAKVLSSGLKGGTVTLYGQAGSLYSSTPADLNPDTLISITFELIP
ncbi:FKBP-type peptidyl-prolyl cis-trans isomerase N-terminal domain-containing protein [Klebsiella michiganensis]|jgi:myosin heavy subunit|uniref:FKBP-type peptidyl-prolyl cis-trans isomerase N-terminal domain-containing protein n=1 Tax=Klebsiella michiganensis TaxID=1134687 RepID=UPI0007CCD5A0|nr:cell envelope biogenesis protein TolA [Klebsiella michiganensis]SBL66719.1 TolA protein [Klebsiella michiganensis]HBM3021772.1 cell envelope biogenesis protein TolA [Klebsiella michiganensis]HCC7082185.1 cell envelope biogenesis protein TolA [Klebsiella michiganensis]HDX9110555.1 cell envelope biogenesis protein TolA [Klebsiella michiganensis]